MMLCLVSRSLLAARIPVGVAFAALAALVLMTGCNGDSDSGPGEPTEPDERIFTPTGEPWVAVSNGTRNENITLEVIDLGDDQISFIHTSVSAHTIADVGGSNELEYHGSTYTSPGSGGTIAPPEVFIHDENVDLTLIFEDDPAVVLRDRQDFPDTGRFREWLLDWTQAGGTVTTTSVYDAEGEIFPTSLSLEPQPEYPLHMDFEINSGNMTILDLELTESSGATTLQRGQEWTGEWTIEDEEDVTLDVVLALDDTLDRLILHVAASFDLSSYGISEEPELGGFVFTFAYNAGDVLNTSTEVFELSPVATELSYAITEKDATTLELELWDVSGDNSRYAEIAELPNPFFPIGPQFIYALALIVGGDLLTGDEFENVWAFQNQSGNITDSWESIDGQSQLNFLSDGTFEVRDSGTNDLLMTGYWRSDGPTRVWYAEPQRYERP